MFHRILLFLFVLVSEFLTGSAWGQAKKMASPPIRQPPSGIPKKPVLKPTPMTLAKADSLRQVRLRLEKKQITNAMRLYRAGNYPKAFLLLNRNQRSEVFTPEARLALGLCFLKPLNAQLPNPAKAIPLLNRASGSVKTRLLALETLGQLYLNGAKNLPLNIDKALTYFRRAEAANSLQAAYLLGQMTFYGTSGAPKDETLGIQYLEKAANAGLTDAQWTLATIYTQGTPTFPKDLKQAKVWYQKVVQSRQEKMNTL